MKANKRPDRRPIDVRADRHDPMSDDAQTTPEPSPHSNGSDSAARSETAAPSSARRLPLGRRTLAVAVALACLATGVTVSLLEAHSIARKEETSARSGFSATATAIASSLRAAIQHEEDLVSSASTFFANNPTATPAEFRAWARWAQALRRHPEIYRLAIVADVPAAELSAFQQRLTGHATTATPLTTSSATTLASSAAASAAARTASASASAVRAAVSALGIVPPGERPFYCLTVAEVTRSPARPLPAGLDHCAGTSAPLHSKGSGLSTFLPTQVGHTGAIGVVTPVYRGAAPPSTEAARSGDFVGWLREVREPSVLLASALRGHEGYAAHLRYRAGSTNLSFAAGSSASDGQSQAFDLHGGWTVRALGPSAAVALLSDGEATLVAIGGCLLSLLAAALMGVAILPTGRPRRQTPAAAAATAQDALYDPLTKLPTRALMLDRTQRMLARAGRDSGILGGALLVNLDWFKDVNEKLGSEAGDELLVTVAQRLENVVRTQDSVGRLGGDVFVILVESAARSMRLDTLARRVIEALHKPIELEGFGPSFFVTASIGVAFGRYESAEDLLRDAQLALVAAKAAGKDRYTLFNANMRSVIEDRGVLEAELNAALQDRQFFLLYEPIHDLASGRTVALEAHLRWQHPKRGVLHPKDFMEVAEETGLSVPIGRWALEEACTRGAAWNVSGHPVSVSLKLTPGQLDRDGLATDVLRALQQSGVEPSRLTLEVAETTIMRDVSAVSERLAQVKGLGVRVAIDDFGSGYAYRADLQRMPIDFLKVDRASLAASEDEDYRSWLLEAILVFGRDLDLAVVAKNVQTDEQLQALKAMGAAMAQGPLLGKAVSPEAVLGLLDAPATTTQSPAVVTNPAVQSPSPTAAVTEAPPARPSGDGGQTPAF